MRKRCLLFGFVVLCLGVTMSAYAQMKSEEIKKRIEADINNYVSLCDTDKSGSIEVVEAVAAAQKDFKKLDNNDDELIDKKDRANFLTQEVFAQIDIDKDGSITVWEYSIYFLRNFNQVDTNKNGKVTPEEMVEASNKAILEKAQTSP